MTSNTGLYEKLLEKYGISAPLQEKKKNEVLTRKRSLYKKVMKRKGAYGIVIAVVSYIFFSLRRKGMRISFIQSAVITAAAAALLTLSAAGGFYFLIKRIKAPGIEEIKTVEQKEENKLDIEKPGRAVTEHKEISPGDHQTLHVKKQTIRYSPLKAGKDLSKEAALLTGKIIAHLKMQNRNLSVIPAGSKQGGTPDMILIGSLEPEGKSYTVNTKLVDMKSTKVLFMNYYTVPLNGDPDKSAEIIAKSLSGMLSKIDKREQKD